MPNPWPMVSLGRVIRQRSEFARVDDLATYRRVRVQLHAQGIVLRDNVVGAEIKTKSQQVCRAGEFLVAEIDAKVGGFGIVPDDLAGAIVSSHYFLFELDGAAIHRGFLDYFIRTPFFQDQVRAQGSTNYAAIRPIDALEYKIPLPPLDEQRRIVARIEQFAAKIEECRKLRRGAALEGGRVVETKRAAIFNESLHGQTTRLDAAAVLERGKFSHRPRNEPRFFGGDHPWIQIEEVEASHKYIRHWTQTLNDDGLAMSRKFPKGTLLISIAATIGAVGILDFDCCVPDSIVALTPKRGFEAEYIYHYLLYLRSHLERLAPQSAQKNINLRILEPLPIPALPLPDQCRIVAYLDDLQAKVDALKRLQAETAAQLDALLPSILDKAFRGEL